MKRLQRFLSKGHRQRQAWLESLCWGRLRYLEHEQATRALLLLSGQQIAGRIELAYIADEVPQLWLGLPESREGQARQLLVNHDCRWEKVNADSFVTAIVGGGTFLFGKSNAWPGSKESFSAQIVDGYLFTTASGVSAGAHPIALRKRNGHTPADWSLRRPVLGLTTVFNGANYPSREALLLSRNRADRWILGRSANGLATPGGLVTPGGVVGVEGVLNLYGTEEACCHYLTQVVLQALAASQERLIVIDGKGDLVRTLKRKSLVTNHLERGITLVDMDGLTVRGFDPLVAVGPEGHETERQQLGRWQHWFSQLGVTKEGLTLIEAAYQEGCRDWPMLRQWIASNQKGSFLAQSNLRMLLERLTAPSELVSWLEMSDGQAIPHDGTLLFSCSASDGNRHHYLSSILLAALNLPVRLVVYGLDWRGVGNVDFTGQRQLIIANGPALATGQLLLTAGAKPKFLPFTSPEWLERLKLLRTGEGLLFPAGKGTATTNVATAVPTPVYLQW